MNTDKKQQTGSAAARLGTRFKNWAARVVAEIEGEPPKPVESMSDMQLVMKALANSHQISMDDDVRRELRRRADELSGSEGPGEVAPPLAIARPTTDVNRNS